MVTSARAWIGTGMGAARKSEINPNETRALLSIHQVLQFLRGLSKQLKWFFLTTSFLPVYHCAVLPLPHKCISLLVCLKKEILGLEMKLFCASELERTQPPSAAEIPIALWTLIGNININYLAEKSKYQFGAGFFHNKVVKVYFKGIFWWFYVWENKESFDQCLSVSLQRAENVVVWQTVEH